MTGRAPGGLEEGGERCGPGRRRLLWKRPEPRSRRGGWTWEREAEKTPVLGKRAAPDAATGCARPAPAGRLRLLRAEPQRHSLSPALVEATPLGTLEPKLPPVDTQAGHVRTNPVFTHALGPLPTLANGGGIAPYLQTKVLQARGSQAFAKATRLQPEPRPAPSQSWAPSKVTVTAVTDKQQLQSDVLFLIQPEGTFQLVSPWRFSSPHL